MKEIDCRIYYEGDPATTLKKMVTFFSKNSITLANPLSKKICYWNEDNEQVFITSNELFGKLALLKSISFQFWISENVDVFCMMSGSNEKKSVKFYFDGLLNDEIEKVKRIIENFVMNEILEEIKCYIYDINYNDYEWDDFVYSESNLLSYLPRVMIIKKTKVRNIKGLLNIYNYSELNDHILIETK